MEKHYGEKLKCTSLLLWQQIPLHRKHQSFKEINITINYTKQEIYGRVEWKFSCFLYRSAQVLAPLFQEANPQRTSFLCQQLNEKYTRGHIFLTVNYFLNKKNALWETVEVTAVTETGFWQEYRQHRKKSVCIIHMQIVEKEIDG